MLGLARALSTEATLLLYILLLVAGSAAICQGFSIWFWLRAAAASDQLWLSPLASGAFFETPSMLALKRHGDEQPIMK